MSTAKTAIDFQMVLLLMYFRKALEIETFYANKSDMKSTKISKMCQTSDKQDKSFLSQKLAAYWWYDNSFSNKTVLDEILLFFGSLFAACD